jgi:hypothetical protein
MLPHQKLRKELNLMKIRHLALVVALVTVTPCWAIDFTQPVKTIYGTDFNDVNGKPVPLTLDAVIGDALFSEPTPADKDKNYFLAVDIHNHAKDFTLTAAQIEQIRKALAATKSTAVYGQVMSTIDPEWRAKGLTK